MPRDIAQLDAGIDANDPLAVTSWLRDWGQHEAGNPAAADTVRAWARRTACWAAENGHGGVVSAMLAIGSKPLVEGIWKGHWRSPAALAAARGHAPFIAVLAASTDPCVRGSLHQRCAIQQFTPADYAAADGHASVMAELAASNDPLVRDSLFESPTAFGRGTPVERAAEAGHQAVIEAMVVSGQPDVLARLCDPELARGLGERGQTAIGTFETALEWGLLRKLYPQLLRRSGEPDPPPLMEQLMAEIRPHAGAGARGTATEALPSVLREVARACRDATRSEREAVPEALAAYERTVNMALLETLDSHLEANSSPEAANLRIDMRCPITGELYTPDGEGRPMYLLVQVEGREDACTTYREQCLSAAALSQWERNCEGRVLTNPFTQVPMHGAAEAPDRVQLLAKLVEACKGANGDHDRAVDEALAIYRAHVTPEAPDATAHSKGGGAHYEDVLQASEAGAGAPARGARPAAPEGPGGP